MRLHRGGRWRTWLGARLGGDVALGDRAWRRCLHAGAGLVLLYYLAPPRLLVVLTNAEALVLGLLVVLAVEAGRWVAGVELPTLRPHEEHRPASFAYFAVGLVLAILVFPEPVALAVGLGAALVDPLIGELRLTLARRRWYPAVPFAAYAVLAAAAFRGVGGWSPTASVLLALVAAAVGVSVERPRVPYLDDDLTMVVVPGAVLTLLLVAVPGLTSLGV